MNTPAERLVLKSIQHEQAKESEGAMERVATTLNLPIERIRAIYFSHQLLEPAQQRVLSFLKFDHGPYGLFSCLPEHPLAQELDMGQGDMIARFTDAVFLIHRDGGFSPLPMSQEQL